MNTVQNIEIGNGRFARFARGAVAAAVLGVIAACGGGGGGGGGAPAGDGGSMPPPEVIAAAKPTPAEASRFLMQASMGGTPEEIARVLEMLPRLVEEAYMRGMSALSDALTFLEIAEGAERGRIEIQLEALEDAVDVGAFLLHIDDRAHIDQQPEAAGQIPRVFRKEFHGRTSPRGRGPLSRREREG